MFKLKKKFMIKGKEWIVVYKNNIQEPGVGACHGLCDSTTRTIYIEKNLNSDEKISVFLHELFHAIAFECHATEAGGIDGFLGEVLAEGNSSVIIDLFELKWKTKKKVKGNNV